MKWERSPHVSTSKDTNLYYLGTSIKFLALLGLVGGHTTKESQQYSLLTSTQLSQTLEGCSSKKVITKVDQS